MIFKFLVAIFIFAFVVYVFRALSRLRFFINGTMRDVRRLREQVVGRPEVAAELVRCLSCGSFVAAREAVTLRKAQTRQTFCSTECLQRHVK